MQYLIAYAFEFVGTPYKWGGATHDGIDCSGLVQEILKSVGMVPREDLTAQGIYDYFIKHGQDVSKGAGALCFYGKSITQISHVAFMLDEMRIMEAGGGGSHTLSRQDAERDMAFVRVRLFNNRQDLVAVLMPQYPEWVHHA